MPYTRFDSEAYDEFAEELGNELNEAELGPRPSGDWEYESAKARFQAEKCSPVARVMLELLKSENATAFKIRYDGGYDEGFSYPETILYAGHGESAEAFSQRLAGTDISGRIREASKKESMWGNAGEFYAKSTDDKVIMHALDELANDLASVLLGDGFGTGEYQLYGEFTADLISGEITDHKDAEKPSNID